MRFHSFDNYSYDERINILVLINNYIQKYNMKLIYIYRCNKITLEGIELFDDSRNIVLKHRYV